MRMTTLTNILNDWTRPVAKIYTARGCGCHCGCNGRYFEPGSVGFTRAMNKARKLDPEVIVANKKNVNNELAIQCDHAHDGEVMATAYRYGAADSEGITGWIDICDGNGGNITLYLKD